MFHSLLENVFPSEIWWFWCLFWLFYSPRGQIELYRLGGPGPSGSLSIRLFNYTLFFIKSHEISLFKLFLPRIPMHNLMLHLIFIKSHDISIFKLSLLKNPMPNLLLGGCKVCQRYRGGYHYKSWGAYCRTCYG